MKNAINYYYDLFPDDIHQTKDYYTFLVNNVSYLFLPYKRNLDDLSSLYQFSQSLLYMGVPMQQIVLNRMNKLFTSINNTPFVMLKVYVTSRDCIILNDILKFQKYTNSVVKEAFSIQKLFQLWTEKIDYFEYQVSQFGMQFPSVRESFNYFVGLSETAISLLNEIDEKNITMAVSHRRVKFHTTFYQLYNSLEIVFDSKVRDVVEYFKDKSLYCDCVDEMLYYLESEHLSKDEVILFFARFLFPTFYFDIYERVIAKEVAEDKIKVAIDFIPRYEQNLEQLYLFLKNRYSFLEIEWLTTRLGYSN